MENRYFSGKTDEYFLLLELMFSKKKNCFAFNTDAHK